MDLRQIRYFLCVAEEKNFSAAAQRLHMSQPPLSRSIMSLEEEIGAPLFIRDKNGLVLTEAGNLLRHKGQELLTLHEDIMTELRSISLSKKNKIVIGSNDASNAIIVPQFMKLFHENFHNAEVISYSGTAIEICNRILDGEIDIGFLRWPFSRMELFDIHQLSSEEEYVAIAAKGSPIAKGRRAPLTLATLAGCPLIMPSRESLYLPIVNAFTKNGLTPDIRCYYFEIENGIALAKQGLGVSIMPSFAPKMTNSADFSVLEISDLNEVTYFTAIKRRGDELSPVMAKSWELIKKHKFEL